MELTLFKNLKSDRSRLLVAVNVAACAVLIILSMVLVRDVLSTVYGSDTSTRPEQGPAPDAKQYKIDFNHYAVLMKANPFGISEGELKMLAGRQGRPASMTDFTLMGTVAGRGRGYAVFADKNGKQELFRTGDSVFGLGKLARVEKNRVSIVSGAKSIELVMPEEVDVNGIGKAAGDLKASDLVQDMGNGTYVIDQQSLIHAIDNPAQIMTEARLFPNIAGGKQEGFVLREIKSGGVFQKLGLRNEDVLLRINEFTISGPESILQAFTALRGMSSIQLDILRGGQKMSLAYQIR